MRKHHVRKWITLCLTFTLLVNLATACSKKETPSTQESPSEQNQASTEEAGNANETIVSTLPLTSEPVTITMWIPMDANFSTVSSDYNDNEFFKEMEKRTGVHIEFLTPATGEEQSNFNLMIASGELPDIIVRSDLYTQGLDSGIDDGYFLDMTPYLDTFLSDYNSRRQLSDSIIKDTTTDAGKIGALYAIYTEEQRPWMGMQLREDWLKDLSLDMPVTYDDWEEMLTAFKEQKNAYAPLSLNNNGYMVLSNAMSAGFDAMFDFMNVDGKVTYGPMTDGWRQYLTKMADWYKKGLIDPDYMTSAAFFVDMEKVTTGQTGAWSSMYTMPALYEASSQDPNMNIAAVAPPKVNATDTTHIRLKNRSVNIPVSISADSENAELCMKWLNYLYTEEGSLLANYGMENVSFVYDESGKPMFNDTIIKNPDGLSMSQAQAKYTCPPSALSVYYDWTRELASVPEEDIASYDIWGSSLDDYVLPNFLSFTSEESKERASIMSDITTFVNESTNQFITGVKDIETEWDDYVSTLDSLNIKRCIELYQISLDRYNAR